jgi:histidine ammonia-lyase
LIGIELTKVLGLAQASTLLAACQAVDLRGGPAELSESTRPLYEWVRCRSPFVRFEQPLGADIELVASELNVAPLSIEECSEDTYMSGVFKSAR